MLGGRLISHSDQKVYLPALRTTVLSHLILLTKKRKEAAYRTTINCHCRATNRAIRSENWRK